MKFLTLLTAVIMTVCAFAEEEPTLAQFSQALGHEIGKNLESAMMEFDFDELIQGMKDYHAGKVSPLSEMECAQAIMASRNKAMEKLASKNLAEAEEFMKTNAEEKGIKIVEKGKIHYRIEKEGDGEALQPGNTPLVRYEGKLIDGTVFVDNEEDVLDLNDMTTLEGIQQGLVGMKEGEKRTLFIHPDYGFKLGEEDGVPPNLLLTFEIEMVKANAPLDDETDFLINEADELTEEALKEFPNLGDEEIAL